MSSHTETARNIPMRKLPLILACGLSIAGFAHAGPTERFTAHLTGGDANNNFVDTTATGQAVFEVVDDGTAIRYRVNVAGIENLWMAHIHVAADAGGNGPPAFWLVPTTPQAAPSAPNNVTERIQGNLASGYVMSDAQLGGLLAGGTVGDLVDAMAKGRAYVVVHTNDFDPDTPSGVAGDSPRGELRGAIE
jgi:hypothetical protein